MSHPKFKHVGNPIIKLIEECSELQKALCKVDRFGWFNYAPNRPNSSNIEEVEAEMDDVIEAIELVQEHMRQIKYEHIRSYDSNSLHTV